MAESPSELQSAIEKLEAKHSANPEGRFFAPLADKYRLLGDPDQLDLAEQLLREGLKRHPDYLTAHVVLGRVLLDRGRPEEASGEFRFVLSSDPQNIVALQLLAEIASRGGDHDGARHWYTELLAVDPRNPAARQALVELSAPGPAARRETVEEPVAEPAPSEEQPGAGDDAWRAEEEESFDSQDQGWAPLEGLIESSEEISVDSGALVESGDEREEDETELDWSPAEELSLETVERGDEAWGQPSPPDSRAEEFSLGQGAFAGEAEPLEVEGLYQFGAEDADERAEGEGVVTETIAELYARQGFYDRAAQVYRELIRMRGGDPALERRLAEVEQRAAGGEPETATEDGIELYDAADEIPFTDTPSDDPFADSFQNGFRGEEAVVPAAAAEEMMGELPELTLPEVEADTTPPEEEVEVPPAPATEGGRGGVRTVRAEFAEMFSWRPAAGEAASIPRPGSEPAKETPEPVDEPASASGLEHAAEEASFSFEDFFGEEVPEVEREEPAAPPPPAAQEPPAAPPVGGDEDDLESFQAWLRSLKR